MRNPGRQQLGKPMTTARVNRTAPSWRTIWLMKIFLAVLRIVVVERKTLFDKNTNSAGPLDFPPDPCPTRDGQIVPEFFSAVGHRACILARR